jgi:hypothetical protein
MPVLMVTKNSQSFSFTPRSLFGLKRLVGNLAANGVCPQSRLIGFTILFIEMIFLHSQTSVTSERLNSIIQATCQCSLISSQPCPNHSNLTSHSVWNAALTPRPPLTHLSLLVALQAHGSLNHSPTSLTHQHPYSPTPSYPDSTAYISLGTPLLSSASQIPPDQTHCQP